MRGTAPTGTATGRSNWAGTHCAHAAVLVSCSTMDDVGRPHRGKLHYRDAESPRPTYPRFADFLAVRNRLDPDRMFANAYTERVLGA